MKKALLPAVLLLPSFVHAQNGIPAAERKGFDRITQSFTAVRDQDGSVTVHFGGDDDRPCAEPAALQRLDAGDAISVEE